MGLLECLRFCAIAGCYLWNGFAFWTDLFKISDFSFIWLISKFFASLSDVLYFFGAETRLQCSFIDFVKLTTILSFSLYLLFQNSSQFSGYCQNNLDLRLLSVLLQFGDNQLSCFCATEKMYTGNWGNMRSEWPRSCSLLSVVLSVCRFFPFICLQLFSYALR